MTGVKIGFIGAGNMAQALIRGFISAGVAIPNDIFVSSPVQDKHLLEQISRMGCNITHDNSKVTADSDVAFIAVKPNVVPKVLSDMSSTPMRMPLIASVATGVTLSDMEKRLPKSSRVIRILPNTPALVSLGSSVFSLGSEATEGDGHLVSKLLQSVGECDMVPETYINAVSGLSGAGPAYMYVIIEALADGGVKMGLPRALSMKLAVQTMMGSAKMVQITGKPPGQLKDEVCSPGGCTIEGISALENGGIRAALINAVSDATQKSNLLSANAQKDSQVQKESRYLEELSRDEIIVLKS